MANRKRLKVRTDFLHWHGPTTRGSSGSATRLCPCELKCPIFLFVNVFFSLRASNPESCDAVISLVSCVSGRVCPTAAFLLTIGSKNRHLNKSLFIDKKSLRLQPGWPNGLGDWDWGAVFKWTRGRGRWLQSASAAEKVTPRSARPCHSVSTWLFPREAGLKLGGREGDIVCHEMN